MGYQENEEVYLCLSRKELQGLCKKHGLPVNRNHARLAKSLVSFFKAHPKKKSRSAPSVKRSSTPAQASFGTPCVHELKPKELVKFMEESKKACKRRRTDTSEANSCRTASFLKDNMVNDKGCSQAANQVKIGSITQTSAKDLNTAANMVCPCTLKNGISEGFGCSTSDPGNAVIKPSSVINTQDSTVPSQLGFHVVGNNKESQKNSGLRNSFGDSLNPAASDKAASKLPIVRGRNKSTGESSTDSCLVSSNDNNTEVPPSFEYFVCSEEGLNLYIDLNSDPMDWIKSLKNEVCIHQKARDNSAIRCHDIRGSGDGCEDLITTSIGNYKKESQNKVVERDTGCSNYSLRAIVGENGCSNYSLRATVGENCNSSTARMPDAADGTSGSSALTYMETPVEISRYLDERNQILSVSCATYADAPNCVASNILSCSGDGEALPPKCRGTSIMRGSHASAPDGSLNKCISNLEISMNKDRTKKSDLLEHWTLKTDIGITRAMEKSSLYLPRDMEENLKLSNHIHFGQEYPGSGSMELKLLEVSAQHKETLTISQLNDQPVLDCPMTDEQSDVGDSVNHLLEQQACDVIRSSVVEHPCLLINKQMDRSISVKDKENFKCSQFNNLLDESHEISHSLEFPEFERKRKHVSSRVHKGPMMNLRSMKTLARESIRGSDVVPRRSIRLVSKV